MRLLLLLALVSGFPLVAALAGAGPPAGRWSDTKASYWYQRYPWLVGCNYIPSSAVNQLEMWQAETFDTTTIARELRWASDLGFNCLRVYLHDLPWVTDWEGFRTRINTFLDIADRQKLWVIFVLFDDCWNPSPQQGPQPAPVPGVHNSRWVQSPGAKIVSDPDLWPRVERYVRDVVRAFASDRRVLMWDLYNEPGNSKLGMKSLPLLEKVFEWARQVGPVQPLTSAVYDGSTDEIADFQLANSDVISFHCYEGEEKLVERIKELKDLNRPVFCTEWLARTRESVVETHLSVFKKERVACLNWGLVAGKTQTIYPWGSPEGGVEPNVWFHDLLRANGVPYDSSEAEFIRVLTGRKQPGR